MSTGVCSRTLRQMLASQALVWTALKRSKQVARSVNARQERMVGLYHASAVSLGLRPPILID